MQLSRLANILNAVLIGQDTVIQGLSTDSRSVQPGDLFIARRGANFDGHQFVALAKQAGAAAVLVEHQVPLLLPQLVVTHTDTALYQLGLWRRQQFAGSVLAVTGSCGKTTTKNMLAAILEHCGPTMVGTKSFNNIVGLPLVLWQLKDERYAVLEVGANHPGEISKLAQLIQPIDVAVICNAEPCHLEGFGDVAGVAKAKGELFQGLTGVGVINADSPYYRYWYDLLQGNCLSFGIEQPADVMARDIELGSDATTFTLQLPTWQGTLKLPMLGVHNIANALAAATAAYAVGASVTAIQAGLESVLPTAMRLTWQLGYAGARIIDDTYNANPTAVAAALQVLLQQSGVKIFIFGGMLELGASAEYWHDYIGRLVKKLGMQLYVCGPYREVVAAAHGTAHVFASQIELSNAVRKILDANTVVLVKGSRGALMEKVVNNLL